MHQKTVYDKGPVLLIDDIYNSLGILKRIEKLIAQGELVEIVTVLKKQGNMFSLRNPGKIYYVKYYWWILKLLHRGARRQPCLYASLFLLANLSSHGRGIEINILISTADMKITDGHCWLTEGGAVLNVLNDIKPVNDIEYIGEKNGIIYWWRCAKDQNYNIRQR